MLVERGLQIMNVDVVGQSYGIAANYLRGSGMIADAIAPNEPLLEIVLQLFHRGDRNKIRIANRAIAKFESQFGSSPGC